MPWRARPRSKRPGETRFRVEVHLVDDGSGDADTDPLEQRRVEDDLVDRAPHAALRDDDRGRAEHRGHRGVRQPDDRPDTGMTGALDEQDVAVGGERRVGGPDARRQVLDDLAFDVRLGEPARDVDRAHLGQRLVQAEHVTHQDRVLVGRDPVLDDRPLADRLQERGGQAAALESVEDAQADRGLAAVLPGRGQVDMAHEAVPIRGGWRSCAR